MNQIRSSFLPNSRHRLSFRFINRADRPGYLAGMQRHHLLSSQILTRGCFAALFHALGRERVDFDDFRRNGLLLPANDQAAVRVGLPLHRGPHRDYNQMVIERVGAIEGAWSAYRIKAPEIALHEAYQGLELLQKALRRELLDQQRRIRLNSKDPLGAGLDFSDLDAMADLLWPATDPDPI